MKNVIPVLTISAPEPTGGAGTFADIKTISSHGCYGTAVMVGLVIQNTVNIEDVIFYDSKVVEHQLEVLFKDIPPVAIKVSDSGGRDTIDVIYKYVKGCKNLIVDPALVATTGDLLTTEENIEYMKAKLFPIAKLITPNIDEASFLCGYPIKNVDDMIKAGRQLLTYGPEYVLMKGGHLDTDIITDILIGQDYIKSFHHNKVDTKNMHGTGCAISTSILCNLAKGYSMETSVERGVSFVYNGLLQSKDVFLGKGYGAVATHPLYIY